jgi:SAM-dependent methyltransferase
VGAGLATSDWWEQYYRQQHDTYWDWYLPNEIVVRTIMDEARAQCGARADSDDSEENESGEEQEASSAASSNAAAAAASPAQSAPSTSASASSAAADLESRLAHLPCLQLGCGNSEVTADLWAAGLRSMRNVDFSVECIERMRALQRSKGWRCADQSEAEAAAADAATPASGGVVTAPASALSSTWPLFEAMDVRSLRYPSSSFALVFDKGALDCVVLESADSVASARAMLREVHRALRPGGVSVCFSLYPPTARARFWIDVLGEDEGGESQQEKDELCEVLQADNPPAVIQTAAWQSIRMVALDCSPLELPNQPHTYLYIAVKR